MSERTEVLPLVLEDLKERIAKGSRQYGEPLTTHNGRDALWDAYEEAMELVLYLRQAIEERRATHDKSAAMPCGTCKGRGVLEYLSGSRFSTTQCPKCEGIGVAYYAPRAG